VSQRTFRIREEELNRALAVGSETADVDFKSAFNPYEKGEFLEILKDIVAMANSGGGIILVGINNDGQPSAADLTGLAALDPAKIVDAIYKYTDCQFNGFELRAASKAGHAVWAIGVGPTNVPIVFSQTGNYAEPGGKQRNSFLGGTVYFRHGAKSEPGNSEDLRTFIERRLDAIRSEWLSGIAKVVEAPAGSVITTAGAPSDVVTTRTVPSG
jgi:predicted HTH transcriptional regulator